MARQPIPPLPPPGACMPDTLVPRVSSNQAGRPRPYGGRNEGECGVPSSGLLYTEPEPKRRPRPPEEEGEAARNNVVMFAGKRSCPDIICYLLSVIIR